MTHDLSTCAHCMTVGPTGVGACGLSLPSFVSVRKNGGKAGLEPATHLSSSFWHLNKPFCQLSYFPENSARQDSNLRLEIWKNSTLPTELRAQNLVEPMGAAPIAFCLQGRRSPEHELRPRNDVSPSLSQCRPFQETHGTQTALWHCDSHPRGMSLTYVSIIGADDRS
jgi:hypothetical protein